MDELKFRKIKILFQAPNRKKKKKIRMVQRGFAYKMINSKDISRMKENYLKIP